GAKRLHQPDHQGRREHVQVVAGVALDDLPRALELSERRWGIAGGCVLRAEVEVEERGGRGLGLLRLQQLDVPSRLLLRVADAAEIAVVLDANRGLLES